MPLKTTRHLAQRSAREDLGRLSAQMMAIVARSARVAEGHTDAVPDDVVAQGQTAAEKFLLRDDADKLIAQAAASDVLRAVSANSR